MNKPAHFFDITHMACTHLGYKYAVAWFQSGTDHFCDAHRRIKTGRRNKCMIFFLQDRSEDEFYAGFSPTAGDADFDQVLPFPQDPLGIPEIHFTDCLFNRPGQKSAQCDPQRQEHRKKEKQDQPDIG